MVPDLPPRLRRKDAAAYLLNTHGIPIAVATLAKMATMGGGPRFHKVMGWPLYARDDLDAWAVEKLGKSVASTAEL